MRKRSATFRNPPRSSIVSWLALALFIVVIDQLSKLLVMKTFPVASIKPVTSFFALTFVYNPGAAFSFLADASGWQRWLFIGIAGTAAVILTYLLKRHAEQRLFAFAIALILGGAIGNVIDRLLYGKVVDFLLFHYHQWTFPAFNIADSSISIGVALLIIDELRRIRHTRQ